MKTREVFRILAACLEPVLHPLGFSRIKDPTGQVVAWSRPWDPFIGSRFVVEVRRAHDKKVGMSNGGKRARLSELLTCDEKREVENRQSKDVWP